MIRVETIRFIQPTSTFEFLLFLAIRLITSYSLSLFEISDINKISIKQLAKTSIFNIYICFKYLIERISKCVTIMEILLGRRVESCVRSVGEFYVLVLISRLSGAWPFFLHGYRGPRRKRRRKKTRPFLWTSTIVFGGRRATKPVVALPAQWPDR